MREWSVLVAGVASIDEKDAGRLLDRLRMENPRVLIQAVDADAVYGMDHILGALRIALTALEREVSIAERPEIETLLRLACTDQISEALKRAGLKSRRAGCLVAFSKDGEELRLFGEQIVGEFNLDDSVLLPTEEKKENIAGYLGNVPTKIKHRRFLDYLLERAALLVKG